jgi:osmoprotectant transport system permease protein
VPLVVAGLRLASVSTIGLVTVSAILGDSFGGLGYYILDGYHRHFTTEILVGGLLSIAWRSSPTSASFCSSAC